MNGRYGVPVRRLLVFVGVLAIGTVSYAVSGQASEQVAPESSTLRLPPLADTAYPMPDGAVFVSVEDGDDGAAGSEQDPLRTVAAGITKAGADGTVVLREGTYRESVPPVDQPITLQPYPHEQVWIVGTDVVRDWQLANGIWRAASWTSPFCQDCYPADAIDPAHPQAGQPEQVFRDGVPLTQVGSRGEVVAGTFFVDPESKLLYVGDDPATATLEVSNRWRALQLNEGAAGSVIRGIGFRDFSPHWEFDQLSMVIDAAPDSVLEKNTFARSATRSFGVFADGVTVRGNYVVDNGGPGGNFNYAHQAEVRNNKFNRNNSEHYAVSTCGMSCTMAGLKVTRSDRITVTGNTFNGNDGSGFWCDLGCTNGAVTDNAVERNSSNGLFWEVSSVATIANNRVVDNGRGLKIAGSDHTTVTDNTFTGNAVQLGVYDDPRLSSFDEYSEQLGLSWDTTNTVLANNFLAGTDRTDLLMETNRTEQIHAGQMFDRAAGNLVSGSQSITWCPGECTTYPTLDEFTAGTGIEFGTVE